jgi:hypothetical protein
LNTCNKTLPIRGFKDLSMIKSISFDRRKIEEYSKERYFKNINGVEN